MKGIIQQVLEGGMMVEYTNPNEVEAYLNGIKHPNGKVLLSRCIVSTPVLGFIYKYDRSLRRKNK